MSYSKLAHYDGTQTPCDRCLEATHRSYRQKLWFSVVWVLSLAAVFGGTRWYFVSQLSIYDVIKTPSAFDYNSPAYDDIDLHLDNFTPDSSLFESEGKIYRQDPSPETDAAWKALEDHMTPVVLSQHDMQRLNLPTDGAVRWPNDSKGQSPSYLGAMDIFHLLHCVNVLRKGLWFDYYVSNETLNPAYWPHKKHCLDIIRQEIMCTGSLNVYRLVWQEGQKAPFPDLTIHRKCRRWDDIVDWHDKHSVGKENVLKYKAMRKPPDEQAVPLPPEGARLLQAVDEWQKKWDLDTADWEPVD